MWGYRQMLAGMAVFSGFLVANTVPALAQMSPVEHAVSYLDACLETTDYAADQRDEAERSSSRYIAMSVLTSRLDTECLSTPLGYCEEGGQADPECLSAVMTEINDRAAKILSRLPEEIQGTGFAPRSYKRRLESARQGPDRTDNCEVPDAYSENYCEALESAMHLHSVRVLNRMVQSNSSENGDN
ncbi:hypothetical protein [Halocynthiibacter styelae]|uniref:DUF1311 domain-containing protein n=1 Tax=Halocynthiibacter styelae TaxID=2761955 RepID=A0A8J7J4R3_9RHOB|nr:hypothetical protein [Paenihalocynthiibacter styelae]MBI1493290.1 hypothetical protein [Paenihalocynthiibacter styelae]